MLVTQTFLALASAAFAFAAPLMRTDSNSTTCYFIMTPTPDLGAVALQTSINYGAFVTTPLPRDLLSFAHQR